MDAEVFSVEEAEDAPIRLGAEDIGDEDDGTDEFKPKDEDGNGLALPEEEIEIGAPNVAIVSLDGEGADDDEVAPIEAVPEDFLPDDVVAPDVVDVGSESVLPGFAEEDEEDFVEYVPEEGADGILVIAPDGNPGTAASEADRADDASGSAGKAAGGGWAASTGGGAHASKLKPLAEGTILSGRYEIVKKIGGGGMGAVYLASDRNLGGAQRAVKEMVQSYIEPEQQEKAINDFKREGMLLTSLEHQSIPTIYDYFFDEAECRFYLVMKYIPGGDLATRLRAAPEGRVDEATVTAWAIEIADVLDYLHRHDPPIVYRDLKPANIMVDISAGRVMLIDFGIARWINKEEKGVTAVGTMGYAPPELFSGNVEPRSDIYSLGSTMFHLLTGADPQSNPLLIFDFDKNPRPRQINPQLSEQVEAIVMRAVQYDSAARFRSAAEMREALERHLENLSAGNVTFGDPVRPPEEVQRVFCGYCGKSILPTDMFCSYCGRQQSVVRGVNAPTFKPHSGKVSLKVVGEDGTEVQSFILAKDVNLIGRRDPANDVFPEVDLGKLDPASKISRRHARISRTPDGFMVEDLGSANGTFILGGGSGPLRLSQGRMFEFRAGDTMLIGDVTLKLVLE